MSELVIKRTFNAPIESIWDAWTNPKSMDAWTGPKGYTGHSTKIDLKVGGKAHSCMISPE